MSQEAPDALLLIAPGCPHCPGVLESLTHLLKEGVIGRLEAVNIAQHPERAAELGIRSVPWTRIGTYELTGAQSTATLRRTAEQASAGSIVDVLENLLTEGGLARAEPLLSDHPDALPALLQRLTDPALPMQVRVGIGALVEGLAGRPPLQAALTTLGRLSASADPRVRSDACHFLGLTGSPDAIAYLQPRLDDDNADVREIAAESLQALSIALPD